MSITSIHNADKKRRTNRRAAKVVVKSTTPTDRIPKYRDVEGLYLDVMEGRDEYFIGWWLPEENEFGLFMNNQEYTKKGEEATNIAARVCRDFFAANKLELPEPDGDFVFPTEKLAKQCLRIINAELFYWEKNRELPAWAKTALANGWLPPKGWKQ